MDVTEKIDQLAEQMGRIADADPGDPLLPSLRHDARMTWASLPLSTRLACQALVWGKRRARIRFLWTPSRPEEA